MADKDKLIADLDYLSEILSERTRTVAAGVLAFCWALVVGADRSASTPPLASVLPPVVLSFFALVLDFLQYLAGYFSSLHLLRRHETAQTAPDMGESWLRRLRFLCFYGKITCMAGATLWFLLLLMAQIFQAAARHAG